jgi:hypothetical protein
MILKTAIFVGSGPGEITLAVADDNIRRHAEEIAPSVRAALEHEFKMPMTLLWVVDGAAVAPEPVVRHARPSRPSVDQVEAFDDSRDEDAGALQDVHSVAEHLITEMFPGSTEIR